MKALLIIFVLSITTVSFAQDTLHQSEKTVKSILKDAKLYGVMGALGPGVAYLPNYSRTGEMNIQFLYTTAKGQQLTFDENFQASFLQETNFFLNLATFEVGSYRTYIFSGFDYNFTGKGLHFTLGYGRNIYLGHKGYSLEEKMASCKFILKPSISIVNYAYSKCKIGSINNDVDVDFLDKHASHIMPSKNSSGIFAPRADHIDVYFVQKGFGFQPKLSISTNPYRTKMHIGVFVSCFIPTREHAKLTFTQVDTKGNDHTTTISHAELNTKGLEIKYNNQPVNSTPFHLLNVSIGLTVGMNFSIIK